MEEFEAFDDQGPYVEHPLYREAMKHVTEGNAAEAVGALERLAELYPKEKAVQDLLLRAQLRTTFGTVDHIPIERTPPAPILRSAVLLLLAVTACLVVITASTAAYNRFWVPRVEAQQQEARIRSLWNEVQLRLDAGDLSGAREILDELSAVTPDDPAIQDALRIVEQRQAWADQYTDAVARKERAEWQQAIDLASQIPSESPEYDRAQRLIREVEKLAGLEAAWQNAQALLQAEDWQGAISALAFIRASDPAYRRAEVEEQLFQTHVRLARQLVADARGNVDLLREAIGHFSEALTLRPTNQELIGEKNLASDFVTGSEAYNRGDWVVVVDRWEPVYSTQPDYQGGALDRKLEEAYPLAARQLIAEANGSVRLLQQANGYLTKALISQPDDPELLEERRLIVDYLDGAEAFAKENWELAIVKWGPIYAIRPGYQNGVLERNLGLACDSSEAPDATLCPP
jgi:tetratricopeptide (TPR) repeat protein